MFLNDFTLEKMKILFLPLIVHKIISWMKAFLIQRQEVESAGKKIGKTGKDREFLFVSYIHGHSEYLLKLVSICFYTDMKVSNQWNPFEWCDDINVIKNPYSKQRKLKNNYEYFFLSCYSIYTVEFY